jgi:hypothetical protein
MAPGSFGRNGSGWVSAQADLPVRSVQNGSGFGPAGGVIGMRRVEEVEEVDEVEVRRRGFGEQKWLRKLKELKWLKFVWAGDRGLGVLIV